MALNRRRPSPEPFAKTKAAFHIIGFELRTNSLKAKEEIPKFWRHVDHGRIMAIPNRAKPHVMLGLCCECDDAGNFPYLVCTVVESLAAIPAGMVAGPYRLPNTPSLRPKDRSRGPSRRCGTTYTECGSQGPATSGRIRRTSSSTTNVVHTMTNRRRTSTSLSSKEVLRPAEPAGLIIGKSLFIPGVNGGDNGSGSSQERPYHIGQQRQQGQ